MFDQLPTELVTAVLIHLDARNVKKLSVVYFLLIIHSSGVNCLTLNPQVNRRVRSIIQESAQAQYILELDATGNVDTGRLIPASDKLQLLREDEKRRMRLDFREVQSLGPPEPNEVHHSCLMGYYGMFVDASAFPMQSRTDMRIWRASVDADMKLRTQRSSLQVTNSFDFCIQEYTFNIPSDLLVVMKEIDRYDLAPLVIAHPNSLFQRDRNPTTLLFVKVSAPYGTQAIHTL